MIIDYCSGSAYAEKNINGLNIKLKYVSLDEVKSEFIKLKKYFKEVHDIPVDTTIDIIDKCARKWLDISYSLPHIKILSKITNQSEELVTMELESTMRQLLKENIHKTLKEELKDKKILDEWVPTSYGRVHRQPLGVVFHNISGNAFVVEPLSICMGLLSKNCNIIKVSADEPYFAYEFFKSLCDIDKNICKRLSIIYFDSSNSEIYRCAVENSNCVVHWGGEKSGKVMAELCAEYGIRFILHGPKVSFEVIDKIDNLSSDAELIARDIVTWEQRACLSPRVVFVNKNINLLNFSKQLSKSLEKISGIFPKKYGNVWDTVKIIQDRQYCILKYGLENRGKVFSSDNADFTVVMYEGMPEKKDIDRCFGRFIYVCPFENKDELLKYIHDNMKGYLQTMGYKGDDMEFIEKVTLMGVSIVTNIGEMSAHYPGTSHDGFYNISEMTYAVSLQI